MKKTSTTYLFMNERNFYSFSITVNEEVNKHVSVHSVGEPCSGVLKHWGTPEALIVELQEMIEALKKFK